MGIEAILCSLSAKRLALLEEDPEVLDEVIAARRDDTIPGLLDLGKTWHALDLMVGEPATALVDAFVVRGGRSIVAGAAYGSARVLAPDRVVDIARALAALPAAMVADRYPSLLGKEVHGGYGQEKVADGDNKWLREKVEAARASQIEELTEMLALVTVLYGDAAAAKRSMLGVLV
jgi:hypothetical protein